MPWTERVIQYRQGAGKPGRPKGRHEIKTRQVNKAMKRTLDIYDQKEFDNLAWKERELGA